MRKAIIKTNGNGHNPRSIDLDVRLADTQAASDDYIALRAAITARRETILRELATLNTVLGFAETDCRSVAA